MVNKALLILSLLSITGCANTMKLMEGADYVCVTGNVDGFYTDSAARGRGVKVPEGETLTPELAEVLCEGR